MRYQESFELLSVQGCQDRQTLQPLQPPAIDCDCWWFILPAVQCLYFCLLTVHLEPERCGLWCHRLKCRYEMRSSSSLASRVTSSAKSRSEMCVDQLTLHSCLFQQFFPAACQRLWWKNLVPTRTVGKHQIVKHSQIGMHRHTWKSCRTEPWLIYLVWNPELVSSRSNQSDDRLSESEAAHKST